MTQPDQPDQADIKAYLAAFEANQPRQGETLAERLARLLPFSPTDDQTKALEGLSTYLSETTRWEAFILTGAAGTGKTSLVKALVSHYSGLAKSSPKNDLPLFLCAPTGRAAKVLAEKTGHRASTVHHLIYRLQEVKGAGGVVTGFRFVSKPNPAQEPALYIVDEASMLADAPSEGGMAQDSLLGSLIRFIFESHPESKLIFMGDRYQLPPVGTLFSPALDPELLAKNFGMRANAVHLSEVRRQGEDSLILANATDVRMLIDEDPKELSWVWQTGRDFQQLDQMYEACEMYLSLMHPDRPDSAIFITYSNFWAWKLNRQLRVLRYEEGADERQLQKGERIIVNKNHYVLHGGKLEVLPNGELGIIERVFWESLETIAGLTFVDAQVYFPTAQGIFGESVREIKILLSLLDKKEGNVSPFERRALHEARRFAAQEAEAALKTLNVAEEDVDDPDLTPRFNVEKASAANAAAGRARTDPYLNALEIKYGYAVTGHKAQGGEWDAAFVLLEPAYGGDVLAYLRWIYTAITRARHEVYVVGR